jgi:hypothetical protein
MLQSAELLVVRLSQRINYPKFISHNNFQKEEMALSQRWRLRRLLVGWMIGI